MDNNTLTYEYKGQTYTEEDLKDLPRYTRYAIRHHDKVIAKDKKRYRENRDRLIKLNIGNRAAHNEIARLAKIVYDT
jgi:hypothetical protein